MNQNTIRQTAIRLAKEHGLINLTREKLAEAVGIPDGSFPHVTGMTFTALIDELRAYPELAGAVQMVNKSRTSPELRYSHILGVAVERAREIGWNHLTRAVVAEAAGISEALVSHYFRTMDELKQTVLDEAVKRGVVEIVAQGLAAGNPAARGASEDLKQAAINWQMA